MFLQMSAHKNVQFCFKIHFCKLFNVFSTIYYSINKVNVIGISVSGDRSVPRCTRNLPNIIEKPLRWHCIDLDRGFCVTQFVFMGFNTVSKYHFHQKKFVFARICIKVTNCWIIELHISLTTPFSLRRLRVST